MKRFITDRNMVLVAIAFDDQTPTLIKAGTQLAKRMGKKLRFIHVVEPWLESVPVHPVNEHSPLWDVSRAVQETGRAHALKRLEDLTSKIDVEHDVRVFAGKPAEWIEAEALANEACLLLCGRGVGGNRFVPRGFSTALSLMAHASVPVMVMSKDDEVDWLAKDLRIVVADDLGDQSEAAVACAFDLAAALGGAQLHHIHVTGISRENLEAGLLAAEAATRTASTAPVDVDVVFDEVMKRIESRMADRSQGREEYLEAAGGEYLRTIATGDVSGKMEQFIDEINPQLVIFGRHHTVHRKPFLIGRMPFKTMLAEGRPILVAPAE